MDLNFFLLQPERLHLKSYREDQVTNLGFSFSKNMLIFPFRKIFLPDLEFVVDSVFLVICHTIAFLPPWFLMGNQLFSLLRLSFPY